MGFRVEGRKENSCIIYECILPLGNQVHSQKALGPSTATPNTFWEGTWIPRVHDDKCVEICVEICEWSLLCVAKKRAARTKPREFFCSPGAFGCVFCSSPNHLPSFKLVEPVISLVPKLPHRAEKGSHRERGIGKTRERTRSLDSEVDSLVAASTPSNRPIVSFRQTRLCGGPGQDVRQVLQLKQPLCHLDRLEGEDLRRFWRCDATLMLQDSAAHYWSNLEHIKHAIEHWEVLTPRLYTLSNDVLLAVGRIPWHSVCDWTHSTKTLRNGLRFPVTRWRWAGISPSIRCQDIRDEDQMKQKWTTQTYNWISNVRINPFLSNSCWFAPDLFTRSRLPCLALGFGSQQVHQGFLCGTMEETPSWVLFQKSSFTASVHQRRWRPWCFRANIWHRKQWHPPREFQQNTSPLALASMQRTSPSKAPTDCGSSFSLPRPRLPGALHHVARSRLWHSVTHRSSPTSPPFCRERPTPSRSKVSWCWH